MPYAGNPARGLGSHFYSASPPECAAVRTRFADAWLFESDEVFRVHLPDASGVCPPETVPVHRLFNNREGANHRYTSDGTIARAMLARGYVAEGVGGPLPVAFCAADPTPAPPACTLSADPPNPYAGASTLLTATCSQSPTAYQWSGCTGSSSPTCRASRATTGTATYAVTASNVVGTSAPASLTLNWQVPPPAGADLCYQYDKVKRVDLAWGWYVNTNDSGGGFEGDAVLAARLVIPANAAGTNQAGLIRIVEFVDRPAERIVTLSPSACDFRSFVPGQLLPTDPTGERAPLAWGYGINVSIAFGLAGMPIAPGLVPGQTYCVNVRNVAFDHGGATCGTAECNVRVTVDPPR